MLVIFAMLVWEPLPCHITQFCNVKYWCRSQPLIIITNTTTYPVLIKVNTNWKCVSTLIHVLINSLYKQVYKATECTNRPIATAWTAWETAWMKQKGKHLSLPFFWLALQAERLLWYRNKILSFHHEYQHNLPHALCWCFYAKLFSYLTLLNLTLLLISKRWLAASVTRWPGSYERRILERRRGSYLLEGVLLSCRVNSFVKVE